MNKKICVIGIIGILLSFGFAFVCFYDDKHVVEVTIPNENTINLVVGAGTVQSSKDVIALENWYAYVPDEYIETVDMDVILYDEKNNKAYQIPTSYYENTDIETDSKSQENRLRYSGFQAYVLKKDIDKTDYRIILYYNNNHHDAYYDTGYGITAGGELYEE